MDIFKMFMHKSCRGETLNDFAHGKKKEKRILRKNAKAKLKQELENEIKQY